jgi:hypothetical protein
MLLIHGSFLATPVRGMGSAVFVKKLTPEDGLVSAIRYPTTCGGLNDY